ncbi:MAG: DNA polymerase I [Actinobacteria bacterium HGW-Actinobacteria-1]|jgi:DNA polymerase-1|nr:MAG: DNA polymerase I [Actinobacteria bacterium HGW-Actinobacteria-1]
MDKRTLAVIDGNSLLHRAFHGLPPTMTAPDGRPTNAVFGFTSMLVKMATELKPDAVVVAFDRGKPAFRTEALAIYKVHRPPTADELRVQFPMVKEVITALGIPIVEVDGWEGDDILGTLAVRGSDAGMRVLLVTGDKDALQLVNENVQVVSTKKGITDIAIYDRDAVIERYGIAPEQVADFLGLKGDTSDNIPGVPGVGEKTAAKLLQEYGTLEAVLEHAPEIKGKLGENLREHVDGALASRLVATIRCDVPFELDLDAVHFGEFDAEEILRVFTSFAFVSLADRVFALAKNLGASRAAGASAATPAEAPAPAALEWRALKGGPAREWADALVAMSPSSWVGLAAGDSSGECLFVDERELAVASDGTVATLKGSDADAVWHALLGSCRIAAADMKALVEADCPPGSVANREHSASESLDPARLFDCAVAAYMLASNRSSYDLQTLAGEFLGRRLPEGATAADAAIAVAEIAPLLEAELTRTKSLDVYRRCEVDLIPVLVRMEEVGVGLDRTVLSALAAETGAAIELLRAEIHSLAGFDFNVDSPKQLGEVLFEKLGLPSGKRTKTGYSTDASVLGTLVDGFPIAGKVLEYRELTKLKSTYIDALPRMVGEDRRLHTSFNQTVAATGRLSSSNPNLQNIPVRTPLGLRIRAAFVAAEAGDLMVSADYSQIELRVLAHLSGDQGLVDAFTSGHDFHAVTASRVFGVETTDVTPEMRRRAKAVNFGIVYGQSAHGLGETLKIGYGEAQEMIDRYFATFPQVREFLDRTVADAHREGFAVTMFGRRRPIPELASSNFNLRSFGERTAMNHPMQGTAADIMKLAMVEVDRRLRAEGFASRMVLQVHDELIFEAVPGELERLSAMVREAMSGVAKLAVPLEVSIGSGHNWAAAK